MNIATTFTIARILCAPYIGYLILHAYYLDAFIWFMFASITDMLDGAIARGFNQQTKLGSWIDPIADKILILSTLGSLYCVSHESLPQWFITAIIIKEILLVTATALYKIVDPSMSILPSYLGKLAMGLQVVTIMHILLQYILFQKLIFLQWTLYITIAVALTALFDYGLTAYRTIKLPFRT